MVCIVNNRDHLDGGGGEDDDEDYDDNNEGEHGLMSGLSFTN